jgi:hypothetical protein
LHGQFFLFFSLFLNNLLFRGRAFFHPGKSFVVGGAIPKNKNSDEKKDEKDRLSIFQFS